ncbi:MAG: iron ABC transporter permease [Spirochaetes bacterium]|nr:iron ABC transporter permease [Spirochaetota bacterium]
MKFKYILLPAAAILYLIMLSSGGDFINIFSIKTNTPDYFIILNLRVPRIIVASLTGASLSLSALVFQSIFRNPLAEAYTTGVSGGASLAAAFAIIFTMPASSIPLFAFTGASLSAAATIIAAKRFELSDSRLILFGVSLNMFFSSAVMLLFSFSESRAVHKAILWMMGDISIARYELVPFIIPVFIISFFIIFYNSQKLTIISFGESFRIGSGIKNSDILILFLAASALVAVSVSIAGVIPFVGLIIPHLVRHFIGENAKKLILIVPVCGAVFLALCDTFARTIFYPFEIPAGIITGFIGGAFFLIIIFRGTGRKLI